MGFAERAGQDRCWHPNCFRCSSCGDRLEDLLYFYSKGRLFCGRDFANLMKIPRCNACDELIFSTEYTGAEGGAYHLKHFCCWVCDAPLAGHKYIAEGGQPHCLPCWQHGHGKVCSSCSQVIDPQGQRVSLGEMHWHASEECFRCGVCDKSLLGGKMSKRGDTLLCSSECGQQLARLKQQQRKHWIFPGFHLSLTTTLLTYPSTPTRHCARQSLDLRWLFADKAWAGWTKGGWHQTECRGQQKIGTP